MPSKEELEMLRALPLEVKILKTKQRIREWYWHWGGQVCVSFSGGKDSTVLAHLVHSEFPDVPLVFSNTGLEYPEIQAFARKMGAEFLRPKMRFDEVISKYGYPLISKEVAEAIHFARRIVPDSTQSVTGGGTWSRGDEEGTSQIQDGNHRDQAARQDRNCTNKSGGGISTAGRKKRELLDLPRPAGNFRGGVQI